MDYSFPKAFRLCKRKEFLLVGREKKSVLGRFIIADIRKSSEELPPRLGITASRKFGKSHERNRFKRLVREAFRHSAHSLPRGLEIVIKPRTFAKNASFQDILQELIKLVQ